jgi:hypothetical protein
VTAGCESPVIIVARACFVLLRPTGAASKRMIKGHPTESMPKQARESQGSRMNQGASDRKSDA